MVSQHKQQNVRDEPCLSSSLKKTSCLKTTSTSQYCPARHTLSYSEAARPNCIFCRLKESRTVNPNKYTKGMLVNAALSRKHTLSGSTLRTRPSLAVTLLRCQFMAHTNALCTIATAALHHRFKKPGLGSHVCRLLPAFYCTLSLPREQHCCSPY